jgi:hypothetical protein
MQEAIALPAIARSGAHRMQRICNHAAMRCRCPFRAGRVDATDRDPRRALRTAFKDFNDALATGEIEQTEKYASAMVALIPCNLSLLNAALSSEPDFALATSAGVPLIWQKLQATAARLAANPRSSPRRTSLCRFLPTLAHQIHSQILRRAIPHRSSCHRRHRRVATGGDIRGHPQRI